MTVLEQQPVEPTVYDSVAPGEGAGPFELSEAHRVVEELSTEEGRQAYLSGLEQELETDDMQGIDRLMKGRERMIDEATEVVNADGRKLGEYNRIKAIADNNRRTAERVYGKENVERYEAIQVDRYWSEKGRSSFLSGAPAQELFQNVISGSRNGECENTSKPHAFVESTSLQYAKLTGEHPVKLSTFKDGHEINIPIGMFVSAESMTDWEGTGGYPEKVRDFATRETPIPSIFNLDGYLLPDGRVYFVSGNAHRVAAAVQKGDESVRFSGVVSLHVLDKVPPELALQ